MRENAETVDEKEVSRHQLKRASVVAQNVQIADVLQVASKTVLKKRTPFEKPSKIYLGVQVENVEINDNNLLFVDIKLQNKILNKKNTIILQIEATYRLVYHLNPEVVLNDDDLQSFAQINAVYNAWPYWREFVSNTVGRMRYRHAGLIIIPVFRVQEFKKYLSGKEE